MKTKPADRWTGGAGRVWTRPRPVLIVLLVSLGLAVAAPADALVKGIVQSLGGRPVTGGTLIFEHENSVHAIRVGAEGDSLGRFATDELVPSRSYLVTYTGDSPAGSVVQTKASWPYVPVYVDTLDHVFRIWSDGGSEHYLAYLGQRGVIETERAVPEGRKMWLGLGAGTVSGKHFDGAAPLGPHVTLGYQLSPSGMPILGLLKSAAFDLELSLSSTQFRVDQWRNPWETADATLHCLAASLGPRWNVIGGPPPGRSGLSLDVGTGLSLSASSVWDGSGVLEVKTVDGDERTYFFYGLGGYAAGTLWYERPGPDLGIGVRFAQLHSFAEHLEDLGDETGVAEDHWYGGMGNLTFLVLLR